MHSHFEESLESPHGENAVLDSRPFHVSNPNIENVPPAIVTAINDDEDDWCHEYTHGVDSSFSIESGLPLATNTISDVNKGSGDTHESSSLLNNLSPSSSGSSSSAKSQSSNSSPKMKGHRRSRSNPHNFSSIPTPTMKAQQHPTSPRSAQNGRCLLKNWTHSLSTVILLHTALISTIIPLVGLLSTAAPSWSWHVAAMFFYTVQDTSYLQSVVKNMCLDGVDDKNDLCLKNDEWRELSNGLLSSYNPKDVATVKEGLKVAKEGGLVINVMARDVVNAVPTLIDNVESLYPFFKKLSVVVFENDSVDGTREKFLDWREHAVGYTVDVMSCAEEGSVDCHLGHIHRYDKQGDSESAIGRMARYRNMVLDYILNRYNDDDYTHMLVMDIDIAISISPFGLLHSLGKNPYAPTITRGIMMVPGTLGTLYTPYDFSAFRPIINNDNRNVRRWHDWFCELAPIGTRWRNNCDVMSPFNQMHMVALDTEYLSEPYPVASSFHGATIYPLKQVRKTEARYDDGSDGQRCEHIGFNFMVIDESRWPEHDPDTASFKNQMYVNPKWTTNLDPARPGGPTGKRFAKLMMSQQLNSQCLFLYSITTICHLLLTTAVALFIAGLVKGWDAFVKTEMFRRFAAIAGVNVADVLPGGLKMDRVRKNTGDDDVSALLAMAMEIDDENPSSSGGSNTASSDEESCLIARQGVHISPY